MSFIPSSINLKHIIWKKKKNIALVEVTVIYDSILALHEISYLDDISESKDYIF